ncbi:MAG: ATP synthase F1 subunit epsilon [Candidatus Moranbacteria bacterium]|nr:ATP synthase F1 subunit epsilon [Candidatus Moranbacteria bacterium]
MSNKDKKKIKLKIATQEKLVAEKEIDKITIPTASGVITVLPDHVSLISTLVAGVLEITREKGQVTEMAISGGFLELHDNQLTILADTAERAEDIDLERAEKARQRATEAKQAERKSMDETQFATILSQLDKQSARIKLAKKFRGRGRRRMR